MTRDIFVRQRSRLVLDVAGGACDIDGHVYEARVGKWTFFIPETGEKYLHSRSGLVDTLARKPESAAAARPGARYQPEEWRSRLRQPAHERAAEVYVAAERLYRAGVGPRPIGLCRADEMIRDGQPVGAAFGIMSEDATRLRRRLWPATRFDLKRARVSLDRFKASIRTQIRGYVVDLCSVDPVRPLDAEAEVAEVCGMFLAGGQAVASPRIKIVRQPPTASVEGARTASRG